MLDTLDDVIHTRAVPGPDAWAQQFRFILRGDDVTRTLRAELRALPVPDTDAGRKAANYLDNFARSAFERMAAEERRVRGLPENMTLLQSIRSLERLELALIEAFASMTTAHGPITTEIPELKEPFENAGSCKQLATLGTD